MKSAFQGIMENVARDRHFGGTSPSITADPYITGYHYIKWVKLPDRLSDYIKTGDGTHISDLASDQYIKTFLESTCLSVTPPGGTLNKTEFTGIGNIKWSVPTSMDYGTSVSMKFTEYSHLPVANIFGGWVRMIRDIKTGVSALNEGDEDYTKSNYAGTCFYWTTKPDGRTVEFSSCFTGMFPLKDPADLFTSDVTAIDKLEIDIEFSVDWMWRENWVHTKCQEFATTIHNQNNPNNGYRGTLQASGVGTDASASK